jgi:predicted alpha/beta hydrolase
MSNQKVDLDVEGAPPAAPIVFGRPGLQLFGFYHGARADELRSCAVVLCNPLGYEAICTHRTYRHLASCLANAGFPTLRFDYHGTGDSAGDANDTARVDAWLESIHAALAEARERSGAKETGVFGVRMGATLAATAAAKYGGVASMVLWAACASGKAYLREMRVVGRSAGPSGAPTTKDGGEETAGFLLSKATVSELPRLDFTSLRERPAAHALLLPRAGVATPDEHLARLLETLGARTKLTAVEGYSRMMLDPHESTVPHALVDTVVQWMRATHPPEHSRGRVVPTVPRREEPPLEGRFADASFVEVPVQLGEGKSLFGILTRPSTQGARQQSNIGVLLPSVGAMHRIGPGRLYVLLARTLASLGLSTLRVDLSGLGDSRPAHGAAENTVYSPSAIADLHAAMDHLQQNFGLERFLLVGLCSGAYAAYKAATADSRACGVVTVNLPKFRWTLGDPIGAATPKTIKSTGFYLRAFTQRRTWKRALRGEIKVGAIAAVLAERLSELAVVRARDLLSLLRGHPGESVATRALCAMCARGAQVVVVYSHDDPGFHEAELELGKRLRRDPRFQLEIIDGPDHTFASGEAQRRLTELLVRLVCTRLDV